MAASKRIREGVDYPKADLSHLPLGSHCHTWIRASVMIIVAIIAHVDASPGPGLPGIAPPSSRT